MSILICGPLRFEVVKDPNNPDIKPPFDSGRFKRMNEGRCDTEEDHENSLDLEPNPSASISSTESSGGGSGNTVGVITNIPAPSNTALEAANIEVIPEEKKEDDWVDILSKGAKDVTYKVLDSMPILNSTMVFYTVVTEGAEKGLDHLQDKFDKYGTLPVVGEVFDLANAAIYAARGDTVNSVLSLTSAIPFLGWGAYAGKIAIKNSPKAAKEISENINKIVERGFKKLQAFGAKIKGRLRKNSNATTNGKCICCNQNLGFFQKIKSFIGWYPVDAATGSKVLYDEEDSFLQGKIAITIDRTYDSAIRESSILGQGWVFAYEMTLEEQDELLIYRTRHGRVIEIPKSYELLETVFVTNENLWFEKEDQHQYRLWGTKGEYYHFKRCEVERHLFHLSAISNKQGGLITFDYDVVSEISQIPRITAIRDQNSSNATLLHYKTVDIKGEQEVRLEQVSHQYLSGSESLIARYEYSQNGQLSAMFDCDNIAQRTFIYNDDLLMVKHTYASGLESEYEWQMFLDENKEEDFKVIRTFNNRGESFDIEYLIEENLTKSLNHDGLSEFFYYDENHNIIKHIAPDGAENRYYYDDNGIMTSAVTDVGLTYYLKIDDFNRFTQVSTESINPLTEEKETRKHHYQYFRDTFNISRYEDPEGHFWSTGYGASDQVVDESTPLGEVTHYYYNQQHDLVKRIDANQNEFLYQWNNRGQLTRQIDCSGNKTHYQYDEKGLLTKVTDALQHETFYRYDHQNRLIEVIDPENQRESITYNDFGAVAIFTDKAGKKIHYHYDETGQLIGIKDRLGRTITYEYDPAGHLLSLTNQNGAKYRFAYDAGGRLTREERVDETMLEYHYDNHGLLSKVDHIGNRGSIRSTEFTLNAWNELLIKEHENYQHHYRYNDNGALISAHKSPNGMPDHLIHPLGFEYNGNGQLIAEHSPDGSLFYTHDPLGNLQDVTLPSGDKIDYLRYGSGYVHGILWNRDEIINFEHNALHQETLRTLGSRQLTTKYDDLGRVSSQRYDDLSPLHPLDAGIQAQRSNLNRHFSYNALDELIELTDSLKGNRKYQYDAEGRLESYHSAIFPDIPGSGDWESFSYDAADNILNQHPTSLSAHDDSIKTNRVNDYNGEIYTYNEWGDLLSIYLQQKRRGFKFNEEGLLVSSSGQHAGKNYSATYEYDALNRRVQKSVSYFEDEPLEKLKEQKETHFLWMGMQMIEERELHQKGMTPALASELIAKNIHPDQYIVPPEESIYRYIYRPDGSYEPLAQIRQLTDAEIVANQKNDPASTWQQVPDISKLDAGNKAEETAQTPVNTYEIRYYQNHINGAPEELVNFAGNILWAENATAWGKDCYDIETTQRGTHQPLRFQGQYRDVESGLHYNTFRYYNPHNGRFISQDPIGLNGGINLYQYAPNPISWVDPWGWNAKPETAAEFEKRISGMNPSERIGAVRGKIEKVASKNGWVKDNQLTKRNGRDIYKTQDGQYRAADTQHGRIEHLDNKGKHLGEYDIDGKYIENSIDKSGGHNIKC